MKIAKEVRLKVREQTGLNAQYLNEKTTWELMNLKMHREAKDPFFIGVPLVSRAKIELGLNK